MLCRFYGPQSVLLPKKAVTTQLQVRQVQWSVEETTGFRDLLRQGPLAKALAPNKSIASVYFTLLSLSHQSTSRLPVLNIVVTSSPLPLQFKNVFLEDYLPMTIPPKALYSLHTMDFHVPRPLPHFNDRPRQKLGLTSRL